MGLGPPHTKCISEADGRRALDVSGLGYRDHVLESFHPAVRTWFARRFPDGPTEPQAGGWARIAAGRGTPVAGAPRTGESPPSLPLGFRRPVPPHRGPTPATAARWPLC